MRFRKGANNHKNDIVIPNVPVCGNGGISTHRIASRLCVNTRIVAVEIPRRALRSLGMTILFYPYRNYSACHLVFAPEIEHTLMQREHFQKTETHQCVDILTVRRQATYVGCRHGYRAGHLSPQNGTE